MRTPAVLPFAVLNGALKAAGEATRLRILALLAEALDIVGLGGAFIPGGGETSIQTKPFQGNVLTSDPRRYARNAGVIAAAPHLGLGDPTIGWINDCRYS